MNKFSVKIVVLTAIGAALYGVGGLPIFGIPIFAETTLKPAMAILGIFAALYGPIVGFLVGILGHLITDLFAGWGVWFSWILGSGIVGIIIGLYPTLTKNRMEEGLLPFKDAFLLFVLSLVGNFIGYGISGLLDVILYKEPINKIVVQAILASSTNTLMITIIGTAILVLIAKRRKVATELSEE